jgi:hypothetical protein
MRHALSKGVASIRVPQHPKRGNSQLRIAARCSNDTVTTVGKVDVMTKLVLA